MTEPRGLVSHRSIREPAYQRDQLVGMSAKGEWAGVIRNISWLGVSALVFLAACSPADKSGRFSIAIGKILQADRPEQIDLAKIDGPVWDEMYIFAPKSSREENCKVLQLGWLECRTTMPTTVADDEDFIVFRTKGRISSAQRHARSNGEFSIPAAQTYELTTRNNASFKVTPLASTAAQGGRCTSWNNDFEALPS